jgi:citrate lyase subunit beta / citryl-CoA lyase
MTVSNDNRSRPAGLPRSYLFVPGTRPDRIVKALQTRAHAVIVDLEDAVAADAKPGARSGVGAALEANASVWLRVNGIHTPWFADDSALALHDAVIGVMLPKCESAADVRLASEHCRGKPVLPLIETARGLANAETIAAEPATQRLAFGSLDFQLDLGIDGEDELLVFRSQLVLASRLAGKPAPVDGVTPQFDRPEPVRAAAARARRLGFGAKLCIHPSQVEHVNTAFHPTHEELRWARAVVDAVDATGSAALAVGGGMVDAPVIARARQILAEARESG